MSKYKSNTKDQILFQNVKGFKEEHFEKTGHTLSNRDLRVICLSDTQVNLKQRSYHTKELRDKWGGTRMGVINSPNTIAKKGDKRNKVGGCSIMVHSEWTKRIVNSWPDSRGWGRYCGVLLGGKLGERLLILNVYAPPDSKHSALYTSQQQKLVESGEIKLKEDGSIESEQQSDPFYYLLEDIAPLLRFAGEKGWKVAMGGDFNTHWPKQNSPTKPRTKILLDFLDRYKLKNLFTYLNPKKEYPLTYRNTIEPGDNLVSSLDYVFVSDKLLVKSHPHLSIRIFDQLSPPFVSDHVPVYLGLHLLKLLRLTRQDIEDPPDPPKRTTIKLNTKKEKQTFHKLLQDEWVAQDLHNVVKELANKANITTDDMDLFMDKVKLAYNEATFKGTEPIVVPTFRSAFKNGWSPEYIAENKKS